MDCLQLRHQPAGPFHYLISEQAKSLVALQELQHEVGALLEFRDLVMDTFPNLRTKLAASTPATMTSHHHHHHHSNSNIPVSIRPDWTPGVRVRKKIANKDEARSASGKKSDSTTVQDSGFSTETSSKETHSASSTAPPPSSATGAAETDEVEDELWHLLDIIHRKGTRLKDEAEALQGTIRDRDNLRHPETGFQRVLFHSSSADDVRQLRNERDLLVDRLAEMEAEVLAGRVHTSRLQEDLENLMSTKHDLEEQLKAVVTQRGEVNSRIHDLHLQFVTKSGSGSPENSEKTKLSGDKRDSTSPPLPSQRTHTKKSAVSELDSVLGDKIPKVRVPDSKKISAILKEHNSMMLQKHLLTTTVQNQVLQEQLDSAVSLEIGLRDKLNKFREENEDLRFQLEDKNIELEGTRARVRLLEDLHQPASKSTSSPDVIPVSETSAAASDHHHVSRSEITTASMKAMGPLPLNLQMDHSSSTESAHDQAERERRESGTAKRRPSKIPLKSYTAPKPPGGKHSPAPGTRSRSGESPGRPHSAQSWRHNKSEGNSLSGSKSNSSLPKSRNSSLVCARDSLSCKLRSSDSLLKLTPPPNTSFKKSGATIKWSGSHKENPSSEKFPSNSKEWMDIASGFEIKWQFPHCLGAIDGKHVQIVPPNNSGSYYFNYKKTHSIVLMAIANANCEFIYCSVGTNGRISDGGVINYTTFHHRLINSELNIPEPTQVSNSDRVLEFVFVGDEAFAMRPDLIKPYNRDSLNKERRIFNYRLSRARRVIENTFGILASRFRIFYTPIHLKVENIETVVLACCALHNFLRKNSPDTYTPAGSLDIENIIDNVVQLGDRCDPAMLHDLQRGTRGQILSSAKTVRDKFNLYFNQEGAVSWQDDKIS